MNFFSLSRRAELEEAELLIEKLASRFKTVRFLFYGSVMRRSEGKFGDIDVLAIAMLKPGGEEWRYFTQEVVRAEIIARSSGIVLSIKILTAAEWEQVRPWFPRHKEMAPIPLSKFR